jgi:hypothetical protein
MDLPTDWLAAAAKAASGYPLVVVAWGPFKHGPCPTGKQSGKNRLPRAVYARDIALISGGDCV